MPVRQSTLVRILARVVWWLLGGAGEPARESYDQFQQRPHAGAYDFELGKDLAQLEILGSGVRSQPKLAVRPIC